MTSNWSLETIKREGQEKNYDGNSPMCQQIFSFASMRYLFVYIVVYIRKVCVLCE